MLTVTNAVKRPKMTVVVSDAPKSGATLRQASSDTGGGTTRGNLHAWPTVRSRRVASASRPNPKATAADATISPLKAESRGARAPLVAQRLQSRFETAELA